MLICLAGKDMIIRTFELPLLPRNEIAGAVSFEAKKYIPFKIEDLSSAFQVQYDKAIRVNQVLFVGIKKETLNSYINLARELNVKLTQVEYSGFSISRLLKLCGVNNKGVLGVLNFDLVQEDEANFNVFENGFPLFSRDINLGSGPVDLIAEGARAATDKLRSEIKLSLDYYQRKFSSKKITKMLIFCSQESRADIEPFLAELGLAAKYIDVMKVLGKQTAFSSSYIKSFGAALGSEIRTGVKSDMLLAGRIKPEAERKIAAQAASLLEGLFLDFRAVLLSLLICAVPVVYGYFRALPPKAELEKVLSLRERFGAVKSVSGYDELAAQAAAYKRKINNFDKLVYDQVFVTKVLDTLPRLTPKGMRFTALSIQIKELALNMQGVIYLADSEKEFQAVQDFVSRLRSEQVINSRFSNININYLERRQAGDRLETAFAISCKNQ
jgi:type IV pilus assembly protein PilM